MSNNENSAERRRVMLMGGAMLLAVVIGGIGVFLLINNGGQQRGAGGNALSPREGEQPEAKNTYVGSQKCASCHAEISQQYATTGKSRSLTTIAKTKVIEDYQDGLAPTKPIAFQVERNDDGAVTHHEAVAGVYDQAESIDYALGSGLRERAYVMEREGSLFQSPISWRTKEKEWRVASIAGAAAHLFDIQIGDDCLRCHAGAVNSAGVGTNRFEKPVFLESSIGCEQCHGPGGQHVAKYEANPSLKGEDDTKIVNTAKLGSRRQDHLCASCHLYGIATTPHIGKSLLDFKPGMLLDDVFAVLTIDPKNDAEFRGSSQTIQLRASNCFKRSNGKLNCLTCHDPHGDPPAVERLAYVDKRCADCHTEQSCSAPDAERNAAPANGSCTNCHMPKTGVNTNRHTAFTDHRIRKDPADYQPGPVAFALGELKLYDRGSERVAPEVNGRAINLTALRNSLKTGNMKAAQTIVRSILTDPQKPLASIAAMEDDLEVVSTLSEFLVFANQLPSAVACWKQILEYYPTHEETLLSMTRTAIAQDDAKAVLLFTEQWLEAQPNASGALAFRAFALRKSGDVEGAIKAAERMIKIRPSSIALREWLVEAYEEAGQEDLAKQQAELLKKLKDAGVAEQVAPAR